MNKKDNFIKIYKAAKEFKRKYPLTVAFRIKKHAKVAAKFVDEGEEVKYVFVAQKNFQSYEIVNTNIVVLTDKRLIVATKRVAFGYFFRMVTPEMFNDLTIKNGIIWGKVIIDTVKEEIVLSNIDPKALSEIDDNITMYMLEQKRKYEGNESK